MDAPLTLAERIRSAGFNIGLARASYDIWWVYKGADTRPLYLKGMQTYSQFFRFDEEAHFRAMIVGLCTLFDKRKDTITLASLVEGAKTAGSDVAAINAKLAKLDDRVAKIKILRHKLFAHRNHATAYNDVFREAQLRPDDLKSLLDESLAIVNGRADLRVVPRTDLRPGVSEHTKNLLHDIQPHDDGGADEDGGADPRCR